MALEDLLDFQSVCVCGGGVRVYTRAHLSVLPLRRLLGPNYLWD